MQVISNNLQGKQSTRKFWRKFPAVYTFQFQCSPMSSSESIEHQFKMAVRYQRHARNVSPSAFSVFRTRMTTCYADRS